MKFLARCLSVLVVQLELCGSGFAAQFAPAVRYGTGVVFAPSYVALGDFNGDQILDVVVSDGINSNIAVLLGNGDGTFQQRKQYPGASEGFAYGLAAGDFNGDGKLDLVVANGTELGAVSILIGNGDGSFQAPVAYLAGASPQTVAVGDFNGDGNLDIAAASSGGGPENQGGVAVLLGNGDGTFQPYVLYSGGVSPNSVVVGDFNGDKILDLAVGTGGSIVAVLLGNGDGTFQKPIRNQLGVSPHFVGVGDFNNDGKLDVATTLVGSINNRVAIALGNGDGTLQAALLQPPLLVPEGTAVADFNLDGNADLAVTYSHLPNGGISLLLGNGDGTFAAGGSYATGQNPVAVAAGDLNGDGRPDLVVANSGDGTLNGHGTLAVLLNTGASQ